LSTASKYTGKLQPKAIEFALSTKNLMADFFKENQQKKEGKINGGCSIAN